MSKIITTKYESIECDYSLFFATHYEREEKVELKNGVQHISMRKEIEYKDTGIPINHYQDMFYYFLQDFSGSDVDVGESDFEYSFPVDSFHKAIRNLERHKTKENRRKGPYSKEEVIACMGTDADGLLKILKDIDRDSDTSDGYIHFKIIELWEEQ